MCVTIRAPIQRYLLRSIELFGQSQCPDAFPERLPVEEAFRQATTERGRPLIDDGTVAWLGEDDKREPYNKIDKREAKKFRSKAEAQEWARVSDRKPWWFWFKPKSLKVYRVTQTVTVEEVEI